MCGIIGYIGEDSAVPILINGLTKLEYRGYDSAGLAINRSTLNVVKQEGELDELKQAVGSSTNLDGMVGIGHTRWSTHGSPSQENAHPHTCCRNQVATVHNGIIENYQNLRDELCSSGHTFESDTDTEVIPHLVEQYLDFGLSPKEAFRCTVDRIEGSYALATIIEGCNQVMVARNDSSLIIGLGDTEKYIASDVPALADYTDQIIHLEDEELAFITEDEYTITDVDGEQQAKDVQQIEWDAEQATKDTLITTCSKRFTSSQPLSVGVYEIDSQRLTALSHLISFMVWIQLNEYISLHVERVSMQRSTVQGC